MRLRLITPGLWPVHDLRKWSVGMEDQGKLVIRLGGGANQEQFLMLLKAVGIDAHINDLHDVALDQPGTE